MGLRASDDVIPMEAIVRAPDLRNTALGTIGSTFFRSRISNMSIQYRFV